MRSRRWRFLCCTAALALVAGCGGPRDPGDLSYDPYEEENRAVHVSNKQTDAVLFGPVARAYGDTVPQPVRRGITNLRNNWKLPGQVLQYTAQGNGVRAADATTRFAINTLFGLGGLIDPATDLGLEYRETNTDETFYIWGVREGGYVEVPVFGPGTERDWSGWVIDQVLDPAYYVLPVAATNALLGVGGLDIVNDRYELDPVIQTLYGSEDSYTAQRLAYLQNMRARLQGGTDLGQLEDIYE